MERERSADERLERLEETGRLCDEVDAALERAIRDRLSLEKTLASVVPILVSYTRARSVIVHTFDEDLHPRDFEFGPSLDPARRAAIEGLAAAREPAVVEAGGLTTAIAPIDVAGDDFGFAVVVLEGTIDGERGRIADLLHGFCEELDGYLASIALARRKHLVAMRLSTALMEPVLDRGLHRAISLMHEELAFDDLFLVFKHEEDVGGTSLRYLIIEDGKLTHDSVTRKDLEVDTFVREEAPKLLAGESHALLERFGVTRYREEILIQGLRDRRVIGRLAVTTKRGEFNSSDRELLERFADYLRQRIVDFNREWKDLSRSFPVGVVNRLLSEEGYAETYLRPKVRDVAILYADISGFSRISEQVLCEPERVGKLIDTWGAAVVDIVWSTGGVFDKMVGDCVIAFWGPPFDEMSKQEACTRAIEAARKIRAYTKTLNDGAIFPELRGLAIPVGVATGINYAPLCVGTFGPDDDYTGFSPGMNNAARLQGVATRDQILCMESVVEAVDFPAWFGDVAEAKVKNVAEPLRYRAVLGD